MIGSFTDIEKIDVASVEAKIKELEKKIADKRKSNVGLFNAKLKTLNGRFLEESKKVPLNRKEVVVVEYLKEVVKLAKEFSG